MYVVRSTRPLRRSKDSGPPCLVAKVISLKAPLINVADDLICRTDSEKTDKSKSEGLAWSEPLAEYLQAASG